MITYIYKSKKVGLFNVILKVRLRRVKALLATWCMHSGGSHIPVYMDVQVVSLCAFKDLYVLLYASCTTVLFKVLYYKIKNVSFLKKLFLKLILLEYSLLTMLSFMCTTW